MVQMNDVLIVTRRNKKDIRPCPGHLPEQWGEVHVITDNGSQAPILSILRERLSVPADTDHRFDARHRMGLHIREGNLPCRINENGLILKRSGLIWPVNPDTH